MIWSSKSRDVKKKERGALYALFGLAQSAQHFEVSISKGV